MENLMFLKSLLMTFISYLFVLPVLAPSTIFRPIILKQSLSSVASLINEDVKDGIYKIEGQVLYHASIKETATLLLSYISQINQISLNDFARENIRPEQLIINVHIPFPRDSEKSYLISDKILESENKYYQYVSLDVIYNPELSPLNSIVDKSVGLYSAVMKNFAIFVLLLIANCALYSLISFMTRKKTLEHDSFEFGNHLIFYILKFHLNNKFRIYKENKLFTDYIRDLINEDIVKLAILRKYLDTDHISKIIELTEIDSLSHLKISIDLQKELDFIRQLLISLSSSKSRKSLLSCLVCEYPYLFQKIASKLDESERKAIISEIHSAKLASLKNFSDTYENLISEQCQEKTNDIEHKVFAVLESEFNRVITENSEYKDLYESYVIKLDKWFKAFFMIFYLENFYRIVNDENFIVQSWVLFFDNTYSSNKSKAQKIFTALPNDLALKVYSKLERKLFIQRKKKGSVKIDELEEIQRGFCHKQLLKVLFSY